MRRTLLDRSALLAGLVLALLSLAVLAGTGAGATEPDDDATSGSGGRPSTVQVVWASSTTRSATVDCPAGTIAIGGGIEAPTNLALSNAWDAPNTYPGPTRSPWVPTSIPTGDGIPPANEDFDFETGTFRTPSGSAGAPTGWFGQITNGEGGVRVYAICMGS